MTCAKSLMKIFVAKRDEVTGDWRKMHNGELYDTYSSNIIRENKSRRIRWAAYVERMRKGEVHVEFWVGNLRERDHLEDTGVDGRIIFKLIFRK